MGRTTDLLEHENMDDNTTPEDMFDNTPDDNPDGSQDTPDGDALLADAAALADPVDVGFDGDTETDQLTDDDGEADAEAATNDLADADIEADADTVADAEAVWPQDEILGDAAAADPVAEPAASIPPPPNPYPSELDRLVRDPHATLGGVASGIAHRYGFEVALTRLAFILLILFSGGTAIAGYVLAWIVIPRATYWPPTPRHRSGRFSTRELGVGLTGLGALIGLAIGGGAAGSVLVPLALVGAGVWLLMQEPRTVTSTIPAPAPAGFGGMAATPQPAPVAQPGPAPMPGPAQAPAPAPVPVARRSRTRRFGLLALIGFGLLALLAVIAIPIILVVAVTTGNIDADFDEEFRFEPLTVEDVPNLINEDSGQLTLDLSALDPAEFDGRSEPLDVRIDQDAGEVIVIIPDGIDVDVDASTGAGDVRVFGRSDDGLFPEVLVDVADPDIDLTVDLNLGVIDVRRG